MPSLARLSLIIKGMLPFLNSTANSAILSRTLWTIDEQAAVHLRWKVEYPPSQPVRGSNLTGGSLPAKLPSFGGCSPETLPYLMDYFGWQCCVSRQEAGNITMVPVISVACRQFKMEKYALFLCPCMQMCLLRLQLADLFHDLPMAHKITFNQTRAYISPKLVLRMSSIFSRNKLMIPIVLFQSLWMFF